MKINSNPKSWREKKRQVRPFFKLLQTIVLKSQWNYIVTYFCSFKAEMFVCAVLSVSPFISNLTNQDQGKYHSQDLKRPDNIWLITMWYYFLTPSIHHAWPESSMSHIYSPLHISKGEQSPYFFGHRQNYLSTDEGNLNIIV